jgi:hypothetical protein
MDETNLLSLIRPWLDTNYQITTKIATVSFCQKIWNWTGPKSLIDIAAAEMLLPIMAA